MQKFSTLLKNWNLPTPATSRCKCYSFFFLTLLWLFTLNANATTRYVKTAPTGSGDGSSWVNASSDLQGMINASSIGDEVWVAAGTYKPTAYPTNRLQRL